MEKITRAVVHGLLIATVAMFSLCAMPLAALSISSASEAEMAISEQALAAEGEENWQEALQLYRKILEKDPQRVDILLRVSDIEARTGNNVEALRAILRASQLSPEDPDIQYKLSQSYALTNWPKQALAAMEKALQSEPENPVWLADRARLANWVGNYGAASDSYRRLLALDPEDDELRFKLARSRLWMGSLDASVSDFREYIENNPDHAEAYIHYADAEAQRGNYPAAMAALEDYAWQFGKTEAYVRQKARVLAWARRPTEALKLMGPIIANEPENYAMRYSETVAYKYANLLTNALDGLDIVQELQPDSLDTKNLKQFIKTPLRSNVSFGGTYYSDSDELAMTSSKLKGFFFLRPGTRLSAGLETDRLSAKTLSGLEHIDGGKRASHDRAWIGISHRFMPSLLAGVEAGASKAEDETEAPTYRVRLHYQPRDNITLTYERDYGYYVLSPRTVSLLIIRGMNRLTLSYEPSLLYTLYASVGYDTFSDDNARWEAMLAPRRSILRTEDINLDIGISAFAFGFDEDFNNGYYDPERFQSLMVNAYGYVKLSGNHGLGFLASGGLQKDEDVAGYHLGGSANVEGTFGIYNRLMLKVRGSALHNVRSNTGNFEAYLVEAYLTLRL